MILRRRRRSAAIASAARAAAIIALEALDRLDNEHPPLPATPGSEASAQSAPGPQTKLPAHSESLTHDGKHPPVAGSQRNGAQVVIEPAALCDERPSAVQLAPARIGSQLPETHALPGAQSELAAHVVAHAGVADVQAKGAQTMGAGETHPPSPSHTPCG